MGIESYGQFCGLARALELVGERWSLLIVRDLLVSPKGFAELRDGLPLMTDALLSARLEELEHAGVLRRCVPSLQQRASVYELTEYGSELEEILLGLGRWGARTMGAIRPKEIITDDSIVVALRATFRPEAASGLRASYLLRLGEISVHAIIDDGRAEIGKGPLPGADLIIEAGPALKALIAGEMSPREAIETGSVRLKVGDVCLANDPGLLAWFVEVFHIPPAPCVRDGFEAVVPSVVPLPVQVGFAQAAWDDAVEVTA
jgi:DNA-binding HxlR family transcriptional regulator/putative sterol carrier protein